MLDRGYGDADENQWGFGQVVAMVLLASPFISFLEVGYGERLLFYHHFRKRIKCSNTGLHHLRDFTKLAKRI